VHGSRALSEQQAQQMMQEMLSKGAVSGWVVAVAIIMHVCSIAANIANITTCHTYDIFCFLFDDAAAPYTYSLESMQTFIY
jgi:hypothetical protein